jgi:hypothetical protein
LPPTSTGEHAVVPAAGPAAAEPDPTAEPAVEANATSDGRRRRRRRVRETDDGQLVFYL